DHAVGAVHDAEVAVAEVDQLPLQIGAPVVVPLLEVGAGGDVAPAVEHQSAGHVGDLHPGRGAARCAQDGNLTGEGELDRVRQGAERRVRRGHGQVQAGGVLRRGGQVDVGAGGVVQQLGAGQAADVDLVRVERGDGQGAALPAQRGGVEDLVVLAAGEPYVLGFAGHRSAERASAH